MADGGDLAEKAREGRMADIVLVLFSRNSMPSRWPRAQWEDALVKEPEAEGVRIAFLKCDDCVPPRVLTADVRSHALARRETLGARQCDEASRRQRSFPPIWKCSASPLPTAPAVETVERASHWLASSPAASAPISTRSLHVDCVTGTLADMAGDLAWQVGLHLEGELADNLEHMRVFCAARRFLVVLEGGAPDDLIFGGRCSTLISTEAGEPSRDPLRRLAREFDAAEDWTEACRLARQTRRVAHDQFRLAECFEVMTQWRTMAERTR